MSVPYYGDIAEDATIYIPFNTFTSNDPSASSTITNLINTDIHIHKGSGASSSTLSATQRNSANGITVNVDFDSITGNHVVTIDTSENTSPAGFYVTGNEYFVRMEGTTVDGATINAWIGSFSIERAGGSLALLKHASYGLAQLVRATTPANTLDVEVGGCAGIDWANVANPTTAVDLSGTDIQLCDTVTTNTDMVGTDNAALASVCTEARLSELDAATGGKMANQVDVIQTDTTTDIPAEIAKIPKSDGTVTWNATALASINAEADTALSDLGLDHLVSAPVTGTDVTDNSIIAKLASSAATADWDTYVNTTDALQAIRDRGDAAWVTGAGGSDRLLMVDTTIATLATQTSFTLTAGSADDDAYNNCTIVIEDSATATQKAVGVVSDYVGATKTVTLKYDPAIFTMATTDKVYILAENSLKSTEQNRQLDVTATGAAGIDWANIENPTTAVDLSGTDIQLCDTTTTNTDMVAAAPSAAAIVNEWETQSQADPTGFHVNVREWLSQPVTLSTGNKPDVNVNEVSDDAAAADNLELACDNYSATRGLAGTALPAAAADAAGGLPISDAGGLDMDAISGITLSGTANIADTTVKITLTGGVATDNYYNGQLVIITGGTGAGQSRTILKYLAGGTAATPTRDFLVAPDQTSTFIVVGSDIPALLEAGVAQAGGAATITLDSTASATTGTYKNNFIMLTGGTGGGQTRLITAYDGTTKVATVVPNWTTNPDTTSIYQVLPAARVDVAGWAGQLVTLSANNKPDVNVDEWGDVALATTDPVADVKAETALIVADTGELQTDWVNGGRLDAILDSILSMLDDARGEPAQGAPPVNPDAMTKLDYLYKAFRNKIMQNATTLEIYDDAGTTVDHKATVSDDGVDFTRGEIVSGP
jgi:hypothetical protein